MAQFKIVIPYVAREVCRELTQLLDYLHFGVPMNIEIPAKMGDEVTRKKGVAKIHFEGASFKLDIVTGKDGYGRSVRIMKITGAMKHHSGSAAGEWMNAIEHFSGPVSWSFSEGKLRFTIEGASLGRLEMNASNRRNSLPTYEWNDPAHPHNAA